MLPLGLGGAGGAAFCAAGEGAGFDISLGNGAGLLFCGSGDGSVGSPDCGEESKVSFCGGVIGECSLDMRLGIGERTSGGEEVAWFARGGDEGDLGCTGVDFGSDSFRGLGLALCLSSLGVFLALSGGGVFGRGFDRGVVP